MPNLGTAFIYIKKKKIGTKEGKTGVVTLPPPKCTVEFRASAGKAPAMMSFASQIPSVCVWTLQLTIWDVLMRGHEWKASFPRAEGQFISGWNHRSNLERDTMRKNKADTGASTENSHKTHSGTRLVVGQGVCLSRAEGDLREGEKTCSLSPAESHFRN